MPDGRCPDARDAVRRAAAILIAFAILAGAPALLPAADRVPRPEFLSDYQAPSIQNPLPRAEWLQSLDVLVLGLALAAAGWLSVRARSREGIFLLGVFSIGYFGFFRKGCICPIGSIQNVALALSDPTYALPLSAVAFFVLPLVAALLTGRAFCGGVCPFGALQEAVIVRPLRLPRWLSVPLGVLPAAYLSLAVLFAATGGEFVICRFDPFVSFFRLGGRAPILALGACFLALGTVVARPYCRFLCPYGLILGWMSHLALRHPTISPDSCVQCRLCEDACPVGAIRPAFSPPAGLPPAGERRAFALSILATPVLVGLAAWLGFLASPAIAQAHPTVRLAEQVRREDAGETSATTLESVTFRSQTATTDELFRAAADVRLRFARGTPVAAGFTMLVLVLTVLGSFVRRRTEEYSMDRAACVSCGRCFSHCPREHLRRRPAGQTGSAA